MHYDKNCRRRESGVSETIGAVLLIALVVTAIAIVGVMLSSQPLPKKIPALDSVISTYGNTIQITHNGGDALQKEDMMILVNGVDKTSSFLKEGSPSWQTWTTGESLTLPDNVNPDNVKIVFKDAQTTTLLSSANFGNVGNETAPYKITVSAGSGGTITPSGPDVAVYYHESKAFTIVPYPGYHIVNVLVDGSSVGAVSSYTIGPVVKDYTISATFATNTYTITPSAGSGGTISPNTPQTVNDGGSQSFTITPNPTYHIVDVLIDGVSNGSISSYTFSNVVADHTIDASFAINTYTITSSAGANGAINPSGLVNVNSGASQSFNISPNTGYHIADVLVDSVSNGTVSSYTFTNVVANHTISASFTIDTYTITPYAGAGGAISPSTPQTVNYGGYQEFTIIPDANYHITNVTVDGTSVGAPSSYNFTSVQASHTINASFAINQYTITPSVIGGNGTVSPAAEQSVNYGDTPTFTFTPNTGYHLNTVTVNGTSVTPTGNSYTFPAVTTNKTIVGTFAINTYTITPSISGGNGTISPATEQTVNYGDTPTFTFTPNTGYHLNTVTVNGTSVTPTGNSYTFPAVTTNKTIVGTFATDTFTIAPSIVGGNGAISPATNQTVNYGDTPTFTFTPNTGYYLNNVTVNGTLVTPAGNSYTFPAVTTDKTIVGMFAINTYTITATNDTFGAVTPAGVTTVNYGDTPTYTMTPNTGYHVTDVLVNGTSVGAVTSYLFPSVTTNKTISATFAINTYTITPSILRANGTVSPATPQTVNYGATPIFNFTPATGYHLYTVTVNDTAVTPIGNSYTFPAVTTNKTLIGTFMIDPPIVDFTGSPRPGPIPLNVTFTDLSTNSPTSWLWNFGDGQYSTLQNPTNSYTTVGNYSVRLEVANEGGSNSTEKAGYVFTYVPAVANFTNSTGYPRTGPASLTVYFTDLSTGSPYNFLWHFGDIAIVNTSTMQNPGHTYDDIGLYSVNLTVANSYSSSSLVRTGYINVTMPIPEVYIFPNTTSGYAPLPVLFEGLASNSPTSWLWHFDDGTPDVTTMDTTHTFVNPGSYNVSLTATNAGGSGIAYQMMTVTGIGITASSGPNGNVTPAGVTTVNYGATPTYTITPNTGYHVADVLVNGTSVGAVTSYVFPPVTTNKTISATFAINRYNINATAGSNGAISPGNVTVDYGGSQAYTITPVIKYHIDTLTVDGVTTTYPPMINSPYTFSNVQANHTISVTFAKNLRQQIFFDTFDPLTPASNGWTVVSSPDWQTAAPVNGTRSIRFRGSTATGPDEAIYRSVPTTGYSEINVSYRLGAQSLDSSSEYFAAQYSTNAGGSYTDITRITGPYTGSTTFTSYTSGAIPTAADNQASNFWVRIGIWASATNDYGWIDDVKVTGIPDYI